MLDLDKIKQAAQVKVDEQGTPVVQIPCALWEELLAYLDSVPSENGRAKALLSELNRRADSLSDEGWEDFQQFLKESFLNFHEFNLGLNEHWPT